MKRLLLYTFARYRFFIIYCTIGLNSVIFQLFFYNLFQKIKFDSNISILISLLLGILFAFILNFYFNFKIHPSKIKKTFFFFTVISLLSWVTQKNFAIQFFSNLSYEERSILSSALFFYFFYYMHKKYTFKDFKKVGIAIYPKNTNQIHKIFFKVNNFPDFIHIDLIDKTFSKNNERINKKTFKYIKNLWPTHEIHSHIMSKYPSRWLDDAISVSDIVYVHFEIKENLNEIIKYLKKNKKKVGIAIKFNTNPKKIISFIHKVDSILILAVDKPGFSGQKFKIKALETLDFFKNQKNRNKYRLCLDGGINENIIKNVEIDDIVSNTSILKSSNPIEKIFKLQFWR